MMEFRGDEIDHEFARGITPKWELDGRVVTDFVRWRNLGLGET